MSKKEFIIEGENENKFTLCVFPTQMGKTFEAITRITTELESDKDFGQSLHIIFTMNTLLNNKQFAKRLQNVESNYKGSICVFASKYKGPYTHVKTRQALQGLCLDKNTCPKIILMCSNTFRFEDGIKFINIVNENITIIHRIYLYYDELHKYISDNLRNQIEEIHNLNIIKGILGFTATPNEIFIKGHKFWGNINMIETEIVNNNNYAGYKDMIFNCIDDYFQDNYTRPSRFDHELLDNYTIGFIEHVIKKNPDIINNSSRVFIPAHVRRKGHEKVRELVFTSYPNAIVVVINGVEKTLKYKNEYGIEKTISLVSDNEEVCETISKIIHKYSLYNRPLVITGFLCVGMGQTLTHKTLGSFTSAIFSHLDLTNDDIYQLFGRITGRIKDWDDKYIQTEVYCPTIIMNRCISMEDCARNMIQNFNGQNASYDDYIEPMLSLGDVGQSAIENIRTSKSKVSKVVTIDTDKDHKIFDTQDEAIAFGRNTLKKIFNKRNSYMAPQELLINGENPSVEDILKRWWGINTTSIARMVPTIENKWCVYWRPSLIQ